jgi:hypothetical protein
MTILVLRAFFALTLILAALPSLALTGAAPGGTTPGTNKEGVFRKNIVKVNLSSLVLENHSLSYERSLTRKVTFVAGYRYMPETTVASVFLVEKATDQYPNKYEVIIDELDAATVANNTFTGEVRLYTGEHPGARGFYLSLYGRYMHLRGAYPYDYNIHGNTYHLPFEGKLKGLGGGLMAGSQWLIANRVTFDWYILGGHFGKSKADMLAMADLSTMTPGEKETLKEEVAYVKDEFIERAGIGATADAELTVTDRGVSMKGDAPFAGVRGLGFSLGVAF